MSFARDPYTAVAALTDYKISFAYIAEGHVEVYENGSLLTETTDYTFFSSTVIRLVVSSTSGDFVLLRRRTSPTARVTDYTTALLTELALDNDSIQALYLAQEAMDDAAVGVIEDKTDDELTAQTKIIRNVVDPVDVQDAATKFYVDAQTSGAGNTPVPTDPGDNDRILRATAGTFTWYDFLAAWISDAQTFMHTFLTDADEATARTTLGAAGLVDTNVFTKSQTWKQGADVLSASDLLVNIDGNMFDVTGTTDIDTLATKGVGTEVILQFDDACLLGHHATNLIMPGGVDYTTAAGDIFRLYEYATGDWRVSGYALASGLAIVAQADVDKEWSLLETWTTTSGTEHDNVAIPAGTTRISICFHGVSGSGTDILHVEGGSGSYSSVSAGTTARIDASPTVSTSSGGPISLTDAGVASEALSGIIRLTKHDDDDWTVDFNLGIDGGGAIFVGAGVIDDAGAWDRIKLSWAGADTFDAGEAHLWVYG